MSARRVIVVMAYFYLVPVFYSSSRVVAFFARFVWRKQPGWQYRTIGLGEKLFHCSHTIVAVSGGCFFSAPELTKIDDVTCDGCGWVCVCVCVCVCVWLRVAIEPHFAGNDTRPRSNSNGGIFSFYTIVVCSVCYEDCTVVCVYKATLL